jgi:hypothetical protein
MVSIDFSLENPNPSGDILRELNMFFLMDKSKMAEKKWQEK